MDLADYLRLQKVYEVSRPRRRPPKRPALVARTLHQPLSEIDALDPADLAELAEDAGEILRAAAGTW